MGRPGQWYRNSKQLYGRQQTINTPKGTQLIASWLEVSRDPSLNKLWNTPWHQSTTVCRVCQLIVLAMITPPPAAYRDCQWTCTTSEQEVWSHQYHQQLSYHHCHTLLLAHKPLQLQRDSNTKSTQQPQYHINLYIINATWMHRHKAHWVVMFYTTAKPLSGRQIKHHHQQYSVRKKLRVQPHALGSLILNFNSDSICWFVQSGLRHLFDPYMTSVALCDLGIFVFFWRSLKSVSI